MDRLEAWFDGGDAVALGVGLFSIIVSGIVAMILAKRQGQLQAEQLRLQTRLTEIEEARHSEEQAYKSQADVRVSLRRALGRFGQRKGRGYDWYLVFRNRGGAQARLVQLDSIRALSPRSDVMVIDEYVFPIQSILPGDEVACQVSFGISAGEACEVSISWEDPLGQQSLTTTITPDV